MAERRELSEEATTAREKAPVPTAALATVALGAEAHAPQAAE